MPIAEVIQKIKGIVGVEDPQMFLDAIRGNDVNARQRIRKPAGRTCAVGRQGISGC